MGNAGDIVPVRVNTHLLAWPRDLGNLSDCSLALPSFVGTWKPSCQVGLLATLTFSELLQLYNCG